jgi:hypothetical protein
VSRKKTGDNARPVGRPPLPTDEKKSRVSRCKLRPHEYRAFALEAAQRGISRSNLLRHGLRMLNLPIDAD